MFKGSFPAPNHAPASVVARAAANDRTSQALVVALILANTVFQKFAIPGTGGTLPLSLLLLFGIVGAGVALQRLVPDGHRLIAVAATASALVAVAALSGGERLSLNALALVLVLLVPYVFSLRPGAVADHFPLRAYNVVFLCLALIGVAQFLGQFVVGPGIAFALDLATPPELLMTGFNNLNEISYGGGIYKSNGVFLLEASSLNQGLSIAILIELVYFRRIPYLAAFLAGIVVTYSGTGLLLLAAIAPVYVIRQKRYDLLAFGAILAILAVPLAGALGLDVFLARAGELSSDQSSAFARFVSIFHLLGSFVFVDVPTALFGRGPGSVTEYFNAVSYQSFDPGWGKVMYEYGVLGFLAYFGFLLFCLAQAQGSPYLKGALLFQFAFLGGYVATPTVHIELLSFLLWPRRNPVRPLPAPALAAGWPGSASRPPRRVA